MKRAKVQVRWPHGLHLRPATQLVQLSQHFRSAVWLRLGPHRASLRSILSLVSLCAAMGATLDLEAIGDDEDSAVRAVEHYFQSSDDDGPGDDTVPANIDPGNGGN